MTRGGKREGAGRKPGSVAKLDAEARKKAAESGQMPLDYLLGIMRDQNQAQPIRLDAAKAAAPYCHNRLSSSEISGPGGGPIPMQPPTRILDVTHITDEAELDALERALRATLARQEGSTVNEEPSEGASHAQGSRALLRRQARH
jgi:hypothetical protein